ncbi:MAG: CsgG/HfaB family protein [Candidatus Theseobacter exili]|nr:CsgG/HfaB family protein [Candidatus Theseobacter exili]
MKKVFFSIMPFLVFMVVIGTNDTAFARRGRVVKAEPIGPVPVAAVPAPSGPKKTVAVADFENKAGSWSNWELGSGMAEMLTTSLIASGRFIVVERQEIERVLAEQDFGVSGRTAGGNAAKIGKIIKAQILISGAVTEFSHNKGGGGGFTVKGFTIGGKSSSAHVAVNVRLYDTTTGQVLDSQRCEGTAEAGGMSFSYANSDFGFGGNQFKKTPLGTACQMAIDKAVFFITARMNNVPWQGYVIKATPDGKAYINAGSRAGIRSGDVFDVFSKGEELVDPESGMSLGFETSKIGRIQASVVQEKFSIANVVEGTGGERGDILKFVIQ